MEKQSMTTERDSETLVERLRIVAAFMRGSGTSPIGCNDWPGHFELAADEIERLQSEVARLREDAERIPPKDLNRRVEVEQRLLDAYTGKKPLPDKDECKELAYHLGVPDEFRSDCRASIYSEFIKASRAVLTQFEDYATEPHKWPAYVELRRVYRKATKGIHP